MEKNISLVIIVMLVFTGFVGILNIGTGTVEAVSFIDSDITQDTTWDSPDSPYRIVNDIAVEHGTTLTINSGVEVQFVEGKSLTVNGTFEAIGSSDDSISFTSTTDNPEQGYWETIEFLGDEDEKFNMDHCRVEYATDAVTLSGDGGEIKNSELTNNSNSGVYIEESSGPNTIEDNLIYNNTHGIVSSPSGNVSDLSIVENKIVNNTHIGTNLQSDLHISNITFSNNEVFNSGGHGIKISSGEPMVNIEMNDNEIKNNSGHGINYDAASSISEINFTKNEIYRNKDDGINVNGDKSISKITLSDNEVYSNGRDGANIYSTDIFEIKVKENQIFKNNRHGVNAYADNSSYDLKISDNEVYRNKENGINIYSESYTYNIEIKSNHIYDNLKSGLMVEGNEEHDGACRIKNNLIRSNLKGAVLQNPARTVMTNNSIGYNRRHGVEYISYSKNENHYNDIYRNQYGMNVTDGATVEAGRNFWGDENGPYHQSINPDSEGNPVNGDGDDLQFIPHLSEPTQTSETPVISTVVIYPSEDQTIKVGKELQFDAEAYDQYDNLITKNPSNFEWENADEGFFKKSEPGEYDVKASFEGVSSDTVTVDVETESVAGLLSHYWWIVILFIIGGVLGILFLRNRSKGTGSSSSQGSSGRATSRNKVVCPNCGADNPDGAKFCQMCGEDLKGTQKW